MLKFCCQLIGASADRIKGDWKWQSIPLPHLLFLTRVDRHSLLSQLIEFALIKMNIDIFNTDG